MLDPRESLCPDTLPGTLELDGWWSEYMENRSWEFGNVELLGLLGGSSVFSIPTETRAPSPCSSPSLFSEHLTRFSSQMCLSFLCVSLPSGHFKVRHESVCFHASFVYRPVWRMQPVQLRVENSGNYSAHVGTGSLADQRSWSVDNIKIKNWEELARVRADELWVMLTHMPLSLHSTCFVLRLTTGWWVTCHVSQRMLI